MCVDAMLGWEFVGSMAHDGQPLLCSCFTFVSLVQQLETSLSLIQHMVTATIPPHHACSLHLAPII